MPGNTSGTVILTGVLFPVTAGAAPNQNPTGDVTYVLNGVLDTFNLSSNVNSTVVVNQAVSIGDTINLNTNGGTITAGSGLLLDTVNSTISGGGDYIVGGTGLISLLNGPGTIGFVGTGGTLTLGTAGILGATTETGPITGFNTAIDQIAGRSLQFSTITGYSVTAVQGGKEAVTILDSTGNLSFVTSGAGLATGSFAVGAGPLTLTRATDGSTIIGAICFLRGTRLTTPDGETAVEALAVGDLVATRVGGKTVFQPVTWIGRRAMDVSRMRGTIDAYPVRIRAGAFAENVPHRDLLVTAEHCVFVDGRLVPARMLVNGGSIIVDTSVGRYEFFHVELEHHAILIAEGLETESYLDTGNRGNFANVAIPSHIPDFSIDAAQAIWTTRAAAPLAVDRATVEPIWRRLMARSSALGLAAGTEVAVSHDPELRLVTDTGLSLRPTRCDGRTATFVVPGGARSLRLVSNAARPSDMVGPFVDDRRELGVLVGAIGVAMGHRRRVASAAGVAAPLVGWHAVEPGSAYRWTDGDAELPLDIAALGGASVVLDIEVVHAGPYPVREAFARAA